MLTSAPVNLHVHGARVSPRGNADNVMLHVDAGMSNTYVYDIPKNMTPGTYWYHSHLHTLTASQTYYGLAGILLVGRADSDIPLRHAERHSDPRHGAAVQHRLRPHGRHVADDQSELVAVGQHADPAQGRRTRERHVPPAARAGQLLGIQEGHAVRHRVVFGSALDQQHARPFPVRPEQLAALHGDRRHPAAT